MSTTPVKLSYSEQQKLIRMARALHDEGYNDAYVGNILNEKGLDERQIFYIIYHGKKTVYEDRYSSSRNVAIGMGAAWLIVIIIFFVTSGNANNPGGFILPGRFVAYAAIIFLVAAGTAVNYWWKLMNMERNAPKL